MREVGGGWGGEFHARLGRVWGLDFRARRASLGQELDGEFGIGVASTGCLLGCSGSRLLLPLLLMELGASCVLNTPMRCSV